MLTTPVLGLPVLDLPGCSVVDQCCSAPCCAGVVTGESRGVLHTRVWCVLGLGPQAAFGLLLLPGLLLGLRLLPAVAVSCSDGVKLPFPPGFSFLFLLSEPHVTTATGVTVTRHEAFARRKGAVGRGQKQCETKVIMGITGTTPSHR